MSNVGRETARPAWYQHRVRLEWRAVRQCPELDYSVTVAAEVSIDII